MDSFAAGDILFIILIFCVIHGIMLLVGLARRRKSAHKNDGQPGH